MKHLMLVPSRACPASCSYCFGPHEGPRAFSDGVLADTIEWVKVILPPGAPREQLEILFHGGEPLMAGAAFYARALPALRSGLDHLDLEFGIQSNLWLLDDETAALFRRYEVDVGTSLDGPEAINDAQRGKGCFEKTLRGIETARRHGIEVGCIATLTRRSGEHIEEIFDFFAEQGMNANIHAVVPPFGDGSPHPWLLTPAERTRTFKQVFDYHFEHLKTSRIHTLRALARSVHRRRPEVCIFGECLGDYFAIGPRGNIYPCQRFVGTERFILGRVSERPDPAALRATPAWRLLEARQEQVEAECGGCEHFGYCHGGCPYNALGRLPANGALRDPNCPSYKAVFNHIRDGMLDEVFSERNLEQVVEAPSRGGLYRDGKFHTLVRDDQTPYEYAQEARQLAAAAAFGTGLDAEAAAQKLAAVGVLQDAARSLPALRTLHARLIAAPVQNNNFYLHATFACQLSCDHCCAAAGPGAGEYFPAGPVYEIARQAARQGFKQFVLTGGEPLLHPEFDEITAALGRAREDGDGMRFTLRTNLALPLRERRLRAISAAFDRVIVSLDGDEITHDARRGAGSYRRTVANIGKYLCMAPRPNISLAAALPYEAARGKPGQRLERLAHRLGIPVSFRQLLPLGRAAANRAAIFPYPVWDPESFERSVPYHMVRNSCGIGQNLYVEPDGAAYLCYAWKTPESFLGRLEGAESLRAIAAHPALRRAKGFTVDRSPPCSRCRLRYLCGGICRAWYAGGDGSEKAFRAAPRDCRPFYNRFRDVLGLALDYLDVSMRDWARAGLNGPAAMPRKMGGPPPAPQK